MACPFANDLKENKYCCYYSCSCCYYCRCCHCCCFIVPGRCSESLRPVSTTVGGSWAPTERKWILGLCCQACNYLSPFEASERGKINISEAHLIACKAMLSTNTKGAHHLLSKKLETLVLSDAFVRFSKDRVKGLAACSEVAGCVCRDGEGCHVHL